MSAPSSTPDPGSLDPTTAGPNDDRGIEDAIVQLRAALGSLRFGQVALTVHEGRVVQIDVTEKTRFSS